MSGKQIFFPAFSGILFIALVHFAQAATTDWGTKGVSDTSRVKNVFQLTDNANRDSIFGELNPSEKPHQSNLWSKDGKWIVYVSEQEGSSEYNQEICKIKPDGSGFKRLTHNTQSDSNATFASDGMIYFVRNSGGPKNIFRMDAEGDNETDLNISIDCCSSYFNYIVSPDAKKIVYFDSNKLYVINADGTGSSIQVSGKRQATNPGDTDLLVLTDSFDWSPDSKWIVYSAYDGTGYWLYKADSSKPAPAGENTSSLTKITPPAGTSTHYHRYPKWSPDGTKICYSQSYSNTDPSRTEYFLNIIDANGTALGSLETVYSDTTSGWYGMNFTFSWSPGSNWIAYGKQWSDSPYYWSIFIVNTSGTPSPVQLTTGYDDVMPHWNPDGDKILFQEKTGSSNTRDSQQYDDDLLLLNLIGNYSGSFPWPMFMPAVQNGSKK